MGLLSVFVINKAGGLIFQKVRQLLRTAGSARFTGCLCRWRGAVTPLVQDFVALAKRRGNDYLTIASTFHGLHVLAQNACPVASLRGPSGIETMDAGGAAGRTQGPWGAVNASPDPTAQGRSVCTA